MKMIERAAPCIAELLECCGFMKLGAYENRKKKTPKCLTQPLFEPVGLVHQLVADRDPDSTRVHSDGQGKA